ncbi:MAG: chitobiase/beta-hexosaminidase C-terminal domain-containing protein, partial [Oscillospiraceae bacterium]|nr:chitobiase/beta-hexosaminidase C-terminal domain-containing protein [Oscillospiraceae bacterium]
ENKNLVMNTAHTITWSILNPAHFDTIDGKYLPADEYTLKVKYLGSSNYAAGGYIEIGQLTVGKRDVNVVIDNKTKVYAEELPVFTFQHADLVADDTAEDLSITLTTEANITSNVGTYDITGISHSANYNVIFKNKGILTIIKAIPKNPASPVITTPIVYGSALNTIVLKNGWQWFDGTIVPPVRNKGYDVYLEADYFNYDYTGIPGYNTKTERVERHIAVPVKPAPIKEVVITGITLPVGHHILDTTAECKSTGVEEISPVTWMDRSGKIVTKADYNRSYTSMVTLTADDNHGFDDIATDALMYGVKAVLTVNNDDTATVYYAFVETAKEGMTDLKLISPIEKTQYKLYDQLDLYGLELEAIYGRNKEELEIYPEMISGFDSSTAGVKNVVISYGGFSVSFPVWVSSDDLDDTAKPVISPADGTEFSSYQKITISCDTADAEIFYTLNGSQPTEDSVRYTGEFSIGEPCTVKAIAIKRGMNPSKTVSATFKKLGYDGGGSGSNTGGGTETGGGESSTGGDPETPALNGSTMSWNAVENSLKNIPAGSYVTIN